MSPRPAPRRSKASTGSPSGLPPTPSSWTTSIRSPWNDRCLTVEITVPTTRPSCIGETSRPGRPTGSHEPHPPHDRRPTLPAEGQGGRHAFARRPGDRERQLPLAPQAEPGRAGPVDDEEGAIHDLAHLRHHRRVARVEDGGVPVTMFGLLGERDRAVDVRHPDERDE